MAKWKGQTMIYISLHRKHKIEQHEFHYKPDVNSGGPKKERSFCFTSDTSRVTLVTKPVIRYEWGKDRLWLRQTEHIHGHFWRIYSVTVNQVIARQVSTNPFIMVKRLIKFSRACCSHVFDISQSSLWPSH
jgi:hypothetical protein